MNHFYATVVAVTVAVHLGFVGYGVIGGFLALRWPKTIWLHVPVVFWCVAIEIVDFSCPLTALERWARGRAGMAPLPPSGFIDHYLTGVVYPAEYENVVLGVVLLVVVTSWVMVGRRGAVRRTLRSHAADRRGEPRGSSGSPGPRHPSAASG